ncbi:LOW QUALITY PROTEIN: hypothetical protein HID58_085448 [Brassica napus]|uniref:Uncharacterized protein n=1 Tax=Brassica napus TaxID=3708 RepID=A0ABQ7XPL3_BRANA|nr:LOW QUALITY PROTEIN: hypothetical protein HID58_085448 [Brassica napus]
MIIVDGPHRVRPREKLSQTRIPRRLRWISPASATLLLPLPSEAAMLLSMAMMVTTPPSCIQPPPDQPPSSCLNVPFEGLSLVIPPEPPDLPDVTLLPMLLSSHRSSAHHVPFRAGFHHAVVVSSTLPLVPVASPLGVRNAGASQLEGGFTGSGRSHLFDYMHRQSDLIPATPPPPGRVTTGRETSSPLLAPLLCNHHKKLAHMKIPTLARSFKACLSPTTGNLAFVRPNLHVIYSLLDSHSSSILVNAKSSQLGLCFLYGHGVSHQKLLSVIIPTVAYRCINVVIDYQFALGKKMKFLYGTLYTAELDSSLEISIFNVL